MIKGRRFSDLYDLCLTKGTSVAAKRRSHLSLFGNGVKFIGDRNAARFFIYKEYSLTRTHGHAFSAVSAVRLRIYAGKSCNILSDFYAAKSAGLLAGIAGNILCALYDRMDSSLFYDSRIFCNFFICEKSFLKEIF